MASNKSQPAKKQGPSAPQKGQSGNKNQNNQPRRRRRGRGGRGRRRNYRNGPGLERTTLPAAIGFTNRAFLNPRPTQIKDRRWGDGVSMPFSQLITSVTSPSTSGPFDNIIPFQISQLINPTLVASGITDTGSANCTGVLVHPSMLGGRFISETNNWTRYRFRRLCASFVPATGSNNIGSIALHLNADSNKWPEVMDVKTVAEPSIVNLTSARPIIQGPIWMEQDVCVYFNGQETWPCEISQSAYDTSTGLQGSLAYIREAYQYRLAGLFDAVPSPEFANVGRLFLSGIIEFFQPSYGVISGLGTVTAPTTALSSSTPAPLLMGAWRSALTVGSKESTDSKESNPDDPILIPPIPKLVRSSALDLHNFMTKKSPIDTKPSKNL